MNKKLIAFAGLAALAMASASASPSAQDLYKHSVTLSIKGYNEGSEVTSESESASKSVYTSKSKFGTGKLSNKEFLQSLVYDEVISDIKGWSLNFITTTDGSSLGLYIIKKGATPINVSDYAGFSSDEIVEQYNNKRVYFANGDETEEGTWTERGFSEFFIEFLGFNAELRGSYISSHSYKSSRNYELETSSYVEKLHSACFTDLVGTFDYNYGRNGKGVKAAYPSVLLEGFVALGSSKAAGFVLDIP